MRSNTYSTVIATLLVAFVVGLLSYVGYTGYKWRENSNQRGYLSEVSASYLFGPSGVKDKDGKELRRADLLDMLLAEKLKQAK